MPRFATFSGIIIYMTRHGIISALAPFVVQKTIEAAYGDRLSGAGLGEPRPPHVSCACCGLVLCRTRLRLWSIYPVFRWEL